MKKIISLLLAAIMVLSLAACGSKPAETPTEAPANNATEKAPEKTPEKEETGAKKIRVLWPETDSTQVDVMENYIQPALAEKFPDVEFEYIPMTADSPIKTMSASGDLPEIFFTGGADIDAVLAAGDLLDVRPYVDKDGWLEEHYNNPGLLFNGDAIYFLCPGQNAYYSPVFYYNKEIFAANGIAEPTNMDEFVTACQTLTDAGITALTMAQWVSSYSLIDGLIASVEPEAFVGLNERTCDWTDERVAHALSYFDQIKTMGALSADIVNKDDATAYSEFQSGKAAMMLTYSWFNGDMVADKLGFEAGSFSFPNAGDDYIQLIFEPRKGNGGGYSANAHYDDPELLAEILMTIVDAESTRHNKCGVSTNYKVAEPAVAPNDFEARRFADYDRAAQQISVLAQGQMDGATIAEFTVLYNMLVSDDKDYLSDDFIAEMQTVWEENSYGAQ